MSLAVPARLAVLAEGVGVGFRGMGFEDLDDRGGMSLRYHPASGAKIAHPIGGVFQLDR